MTSNSSPDSSLNSHPLARKTLKYDFGKGALEGIIQAGYQSVALLILIEVFLKPKGVKADWAQSLIFSSSFLGMALALFYAPITSIWKMKKNVWIVLPTFFVGVFFLVGAITENLYIYVGFVGLAHTLLPLRLPYLTEIYHENYPAHKRGRYHSLSLIAAQVTTVIFSYLAGEWLDQSLSNWRWILIIMAVAAFASSFLLWRIPTSPVKEAMPFRNPLRSLKWLYKDKLFGYVLFVWFIFGFANLWILPIRISYLAEGLTLSPSTVAMLAGVVPEATRLLFLPMWAFLFDRINFIVLRMLMNAFFLVGLWFYFHSETLWGIGLGSFFHGIGFSGGRLAWGLWVTKMVPKERSGEYMAVHVTLTGLRGLIGPIIGYWCLTKLSTPEQPAYQLLSEISCGLFLLSLFMLAPVIRHGNRNGD